MLELNRNPDNYFAEVEQASFSPANVVPGISHSPDKMLQFRIFSYADAHRHRLGVNYEALPVNKPRCPVHNYNRDGAMRFDGNDGGSVNYEPNSFGGPKEDHRFKEPPLPIEGAADRYDHRAGNDDYTQAGNLYRLMSQAERDRLMDAIAGAMTGVPEFIQQRQIGHFAKADPAYGAGCRQAPGSRTEGRRGGVRPRRSLQRIGLIGARRQRFHGAAPFLFEAAPADSPALRPDEKNESEEIAAAINTAHIASSPRKGQNTTA